MSARLRAQHVQRNPHREFGQPALLVRSKCACSRVIVTALLIGREEAPERDDRAAGGELDHATVSQSATQLDRGGRAAGVGHLRGDGALPDQLVHRELLAA